VELPVDLLPPILALVTPDPRSLLMVLEVARMKRMHVGYKLKRMLVMDTKAKPVEQPTATMEAVPELLAVILSKVDILSKADILSRRLMLSSQLQVPARVVSWASSWVRPLALNKAILTRVIHNKVWVTDSNNTCNPSVELEVALVLVPWVLVEVF